MKSGRIFWGIFFIIAGAALLLARYSIFIPFEGLFRLWPLLLIVWGVAIFIHSRPLRAVLLGLVAAVAAVWVIGAVHHGAEFNDTYSSEPYSEQVWTERLDSAVTHATLELDAGAGKCTINGTCDSLIVARTKSRFGNFKFDAEKQDSSEHITLTMKGSHGWYFGGGSHGWHFGGGGNNADIQLNAKPAWNMDLNLGAASIDMDLTPYIVQTAHLDCGAAKAKIKIGDRSDVTHMEISAGASSLEVDIPSGSGCQITTDGALLAKDFPGFTKNGDNTYYTENYNTASKKIFIALDAGASKLVVHRY